MKKTHRRLEALEAQHNARLDAAVLGWLRQYWQAVNELTLAQFDAICYGDDDALERWLDQIGLQEAGARLDGRYGEAACEAAVQRVTDALVESLERKIEAGQPLTDDERVAIGDDGPLDRLARLLSDAELDQWAAAPLDERRALVRALAATYGVD